MLEKIALYTRTKIEEHMLIVMDKSMYDENLAQPLATITKLIEIAVTFLTG